MSLQHPNSPGTARARDSAGSAAPGGSRKPTELSRPACRHLAVPSRPARFKQVNRVNPLVTSVDNQLKASQTMSVSLNPHCLKWKVWTSSWSPLVTSLSRSRSVSCLHVEKAAHCCIYISAAHLSHVPLLSKLPSLALPYCVRHSRASYCQRPCGFRGLNHWVSQEGKRFPEPRGMRVRDPPALAGLHQRLSQSPSMPYIATLAGLGQQQTPEAAGISNASHLKDLRASGLICGPSKPRRCIVLATG